MTADGARPERDAEQRKAELPLLRYCALACRSTYRLKTNYVHTTQANSSETDRRKDTRCAVATADRKKLP